MEAAINGSPTKQIENDSSVDNNIHNNVFAKSNLNVVLIAVKD